MQIGIELAYLLAALVVALALLLWIAVSLILGPMKAPLPEWFGAYPDNKKLILVLIVALSGACGGATASLKWLYHSVAKKRWHRDRLVWRLVVPILSAVLSLFTGFMITSHLVPFLTGEPLTSPTVCAGFGFFVGLFSDNILASLQRLALRILGTVDRASTTADDSGTPRGG